MFVCPKKLKTCKAMDVYLYYVVILLLPNKRIDWNHSLQGHCKCVNQSIKKGKKSLNGLFPGQRCDEKRLFPLCLPWKTVK